MAHRSSMHLTVNKCRLLALCCIVLSLALQSTGSAVYEMGLADREDYSDGYRDWVPAAQMEAARPWDVSEERPWQREKSQQTSGTILGYQHSRELESPPFSRDFDVGDGQSAREALEAIGLLENEETLRDFKNWLESKIERKIPSVVKADSREQKITSLDSVAKTSAADRFMSSAYDADYVVPQLTRRGHGNTQDDKRNVGKSSSDSYKPIPRRILEATKNARRASELERTSKRSPNCMRRCMAQGLLHPAQCHSLC